MSDLRNKATAALAAASGDAVLALESVIRERDTAQAESKKAREADDYLTTFAESDSYVVIIPVERWRTFRRLVAESRKAVQP